MAQSKITRIHKDLDYVRNLFNLELAKKLNEQRFPKEYSDKILAQSILENNLLNFNLNIKQNSKRKKIFDLEW